MALMLLSLRALQQIDPGHKINLTLYREGSVAAESLGLVNQDTGDLLGDAYFVLRGLMLPVECKSKNPLAHFDCDNPEQNATTNIVSQHVVAVDSRFGEYGSCNANKSGVYECFCGDFHSQKPCGPKVGYTDVATRESKHGHPRPGSEAWIFWRANLAIKTGGSWYSTTAAGQCAERAAEAPCTWRVLTTTRQIVAGCLETRIAQVIQAYSPSCFDACPQPHNASTACVVDCYYMNLLGNKGGRAIIKPSDGMPRSLVEDAWSKAFASADPAQGGCPDAHAPESAGPWPLAWSRRARRGEGGVEAAVEERP